ncbi:MAG TPA: hypothetical protein VF462_07345 [Micromonosporaceae bacterium]
MVDRNIVRNMGEAVAVRRSPAITRWNRLEGRPRTHSFDRALKAEVRDALWMLTRQWQLGEFQGDDAGSPVLARACIDVAPITRFQAGSGPARPLDADRPLESTVESRPLPLSAGAQYLSLDLRLLVGRRWLKLLTREAARPGGLSADYRDAYRQQYQILVPDPSRPADAAICAHPDAWQQVSAAAGRTMDGIALLAHLAEPDGQAYDDIGAAGSDQPKLAALATRLAGWFADLIQAPAAEGSEAWTASRLEYQFGLSAPGYAMRAEEYSQGHLDWYALQRQAGEIDAAAEPAPSAPERRVHTFLPASIVFEGMPNTRWWAFEDRRTNFGEVRPDSTDLGKLLLLEFGLIYANDWFVLPYTVPIGTVIEVKGIAVSTVFGERFWVEPVRELPAQEWQRWSMFALTPDESEAASPAVRLVLLPVTPHVQESRPVEEVVFIRDEMANMVWGIERRVPLPSGSSRPGVEAAREYREYLQRLVPTPAGPPPEPAAPIRYQVMNTVSEHWIPFIPAHVEGSVREIQLQRAALPRILDGATGRPEKVHPRTTLLRHGLPRAYFIHEEEVPRAGAVVTQTYQRTRWIGGKVAVWFGARKQTGRGEGYSGLRFDGLVQTGS